MILINCRKNQKNMWLLHTDSPNRLQKAKINLFEEMYLVHRALRWKMKKSS